MKNARDRFITRGNRSRPRQPVPSAMASEEKQRMLLALAPLLLHPPPIVQTPYLLHSITETMDVSSASVGIAGLTKKETQPWVK